MWLGLLDLGFWGSFFALMVLTQMTIASVTLYLHRCQAHRAIDFHPVICHFFRFWLWLTTGMVTRQWAAVHRKHHAKCESKDDPHSPQIAGIWTVLFKGLQLYRVAARDQETVDKYGHGAPNDWLERNLYEPRHHYGIYLMLAIDVLLFGWAGVLIWVVQLLWIPLFAAGVINGIGHYWGYRNFESPDASKNIFPWGFFIGGEELHNNHHAFGTSAKFSVKPWEFDIGWQYIRLLKRLRLAKVKRSLPKMYQNKNKCAVDEDTVLAVITNRFQLMANYTKTVIGPIILEERSKFGQKGNALLKKASALLSRDQRLFKPADYEQLKVILATSKQLEVVHQFHQQLKTIWSKTHASKEELLRYLEDWCLRAEATGIQVLQEFAKTIKTCSLVEPQTFAAR